MFIGHFAVGFASKRVAPKTSLGLLLAAPLFLDLIWPIFLALGWESVRVDPGNTVFTPLAFDHYPWSHSLAMAIVWSLLFGGIYAARTRYRTGAIVLGLGVLSHWVLDWATHRPDLPLYPGGSQRLGLGLWNSFAGTAIVESGMFVAAVAIYLRTTRARDRTGSIALWSLLLFTAVIYVMNATASQPPPAEALKWVAFATWLFPLWAWWADRHRVPAG